ncbi:MAG: 3-hydroxyacyl-CoA dehydrogenase [Alphaproteobacteria bacterium]|nr:3-hydroxyacyl-CoA dehydrogenase [Alphaproteobacteria bacterium]
MSAFKKVAVLGSGVMGGGIAAHVANAGIPVMLLDIVPQGANNRNQLAEAALGRLKKTNPAALMSDRAAGLIQPGNFEDDLSRIGDCDWIVEAVIERVDLKQELYRKVAAAMKPTAIVSSNTSTIPLGTLVEGLPEAFANRFAITHFFNPPRYMRLLEVVKGPRTEDDVLPALRRFGDVALGKAVIDCKDTPGFVGNRIGIFWSTVAMSQAMSLGLTVEEADSVVGKPMGIPKTGIFGLGDLTGIDLAPHVSASMLKLLPPDDPYCKIYDANGQLAQTIQWMIGQGLTGRKGKGGFYRQDKAADGSRTRLTLDYATRTYRPTRRAELASVKAARKGLRALVEHPDKGGQYAWAVLSRVLAYAAELAPEIANSIADVDTAMKTGYAWKWGPFEQLDLVGPKWFADRLRAEGKPVPRLIEAVGAGTFYKEEGAARLIFTPEGRYAELKPAAGAWKLADVKRGKQPVLSNKGASIWDLGDGVACLELHTKMNAIDANIVAMVREAAKLDKKGFKALVIGHDGDNFSVGANIGLGLFAANTAMWPVIEQNIKEGQDAYRALRNAPFPVVGAPSGMALGGGCEILMHCDAVQAHAESYIGLVEVGVGLIPGWGGTTTLLTRWMQNAKRPQGPMPAISQAFEIIGTAQVARSAAEAKEKLLLRPSDGITMNRDRVLADAKAKALAMVPGYKPAEPAEIFLPGATARTALAMAVEGFRLQGKATPHDVTVMAALARVLSGGDVDILDPVKETDLLALERAVFLSLIKTNATLDRIEHMLTTGKPLRN